MDNAPSETVPASDRRQTVGLVRLGFALVGTVLVGVGGYLQYPPIGFAVSGIMLFGIAVLGELRGRA